MSVLSQQFLRRSGAAAIAAAACLATVAPGSAAQAQPAAEYPMVMRYNVRVPMRDGIRLSADVYRPPDEIPHPAIMQVTPYSNNSATSMDFGIGGSTPGCWAASHPPSRTCSTSSR